MPGTGLVLGDTPVSSALIELAFFYFLFLEIVEERWRDRERGKH